MNTSNIDTSKNWDDLKYKIRDRWSRFTAEEVEAFKDDFGALSRKIQELYGYPQERADEEVRDFKAKLSNEASHQHRTTHHKGQHQAHHGHAR